MKDDDEGDMSTCHGHCRQKVPTIKKFAVQTEKGQSRKPPGHDCEHKFMGVGSRVTFSAITFEWMGPERK